MSRTLAGIITALTLLVAAPDAQPATKMRDGFASMVITDGTSLLPRNGITSATGGDDVYYWIQWKEPIPRSTLRCVVKGPDADIDETENFLEPNEEGYSVCGMGTEDSDSGTFVFTQYLNGEMVGEKSITLEKQPFFSKLSMRKKWKYLMGALAVVILAAYWIRRKMTGDTRSLKAVLGGEGKAEAAVRDALVIGSRVPGAAAKPVQTIAVTPAESDESQELRKLGTQFQTMVAQPDKKAGLDVGRRYLGALLKAGNAPEAVKVFRQCVAADPAFRLAQSDQVLPMAKAARTAGDSQLAVAAVRGFDKAWPGDALTPEVFVFSAKLMAEDLNNPEMAKKILQHVVAKHPGHYIAQEARRMLEGMK